MTRLVFPLIFSSHFVAFQNFGYGWELSRARVFPFFPGGGMLCGLQLTTLASWGLCKGGILGACDSDSMS